MRFMDDGPEALLTDKTFSVSDFKEGFKGSTGSKDFQKNGLRQTRSLNDVQKLNVTAVERESAKTLRILRQLEGEVQHLNRKVNSFDSESERWSIRYSRRAVIASNALLALLTFVKRFERLLRDEHQLSGFLRTIFTLAELPGEAEDTMATFVLQAFLSASFRASPFLLSSCLFATKVSSMWNFAFFLSTAMSLRVAMLSDGMKRFASLNAFLNCMYLIARYYFLNGFPSFKELTFL